MAYPTIVLNNATGSDTQASGAGPSTAIYGTDASTSGDGLTVTVPNKDLTDVAVDGSHVIWINDTASNRRRFSKITGKGNSGAADAYVTVFAAYYGSLSGMTYAIGGKRATIAATKKVWNRQDCETGGWAVEFEYTGTDYTVNENIGFGIELASSGWMAFRGTGAKRPTIVQQANADTFSGYWYGFSLDSLILKATNASRPVIGALWGGTYSGCLLRNCVLDGFYRLQITSSYYLVGVEILNTTDTARAVYCSDGGAINMDRCYIHDNPGHGMYNFAYAAQWAISNSVFARNGGRGIYHQTDNWGSYCAYKNVVLAFNTGDGVRAMDDNVSNNWGQQRFERCVFYGNGGYGLNLGTSNEGDVVGGRLITDAVVLEDCAFGGNTSGACNLTLTRNAGAITLAGNPFMGATAAAGTHDWRLALGSALRQAGRRSTLSRDLSLAHQDLDMGAYQQAPPIQGRTRVTPPAR